LTDVFSDAGNISKLSFILLLKNRLAELKSSSNQSTETPTSPGRCAAQPLAIPYIAHHAAAVIATRALRLFLATFCALLVRSMLFF
jgi:hypothetical protein